MDTCAVEVGLLKKKPCGQHAVAHCANCEMALCTKHAVPQLNSMKARTGKFMCAECDRSNKRVDTSAPTAKPGAPKPGGAPATAAPKPAAPAARPAAPTAPGAKAPEKAHDNVDDPLEFKPTKK